MFSDTNQCIVPAMSAHHLQAHPPSTPKPASDILYQTHSARGRQSFGRFRRATRGRSRSQSRSHSQPRKITFEKKSLKAIP